MKIVLNKNEFKELEIFVHNYARTSARAYVAIDPEEKGLLEKTDSELTGEMLQVLDGFVVLNPIVDDTYMIDISSELFTAYMSGVNKIQGAMAGYTDDLIQISAKHHVAIVCAHEKVRDASGNRLFKKVLCSVIDVVVSFLGLGELYSDLRHVAESIDNDHTLDLEAKEVKEEIAKALTK